MEDTGLIRKFLGWRARMIVFGSQADQAIDQELPFYIMIDRAHLVMLVEQGIIPVTAAQQLLASMDALVAENFASLRDRAAPRGLYLLYEQHLIEQLGEDIGGALHIGRSRNDINATVLSLRLRQYYYRLIREGLRLQAVVIRCADRNLDVTMPSYTHYQAAVPTTYGHYLAGVALAIERDLQALGLAAEHLARCPLGAGAGGGTSVVIDTSRTANLLGFGLGVLHSMDAVASRDVVLRLLGDRKSVV